MESGNYIRDRFEGLEKRIDKTEDDLDVLRDIRTEMELLRTAVNRWATGTFTVGGLILATAAITLLLGGAAP